MYSSMHVLSDISAHEPQNEYSSRTNRGAVKFFAYAYEVKTEAYKH